MLDTDRWERSAAFSLEVSQHVAFYARNDHLGFGVPYDFLGVPHTFFPDFLVRLAGNVGATMILEVKGLITGDGWGGGFSTFAGNQQCWVKQLTYLSGQHPPKEGDRPSRL